MQETEAAIIPERACLRCGTRWPDIEYEIETGPQICGGPLLRYRTDYCKAKCPTCGRATRWHKVQRDAVAEWDKINMGPRLGFNCPKCGSPIVERNSRFGVFHPCSRFGCDIILNEYGFSDKATRDARIAAHTLFDALWKRWDKGDAARRKDMYARLAEYMGLEEAHIGAMDEEQCRAVIRFSVMVKKS